MQRKVNLMNISWNLSMSKDKVQAKDKRAMANIQKRRVRKLLSVKIKIRNQMMN